MKPAQVTICDGMAPDQDATEFMQSVVDAVNEEWSRHGCTGCQLTRVIWEKGVVVLQTRPGKEPLTVGVVRKAVRRV